MRFIECIQGSPEWLAARAGLATASVFVEICTMVGGLTPQQAIYVKAVLAGEDKKSAMEKAGYKAAPSSTTVARSLNGEKTEEFSDTTKRYAMDLLFEQISGKPYGIPPKAWILERGHIMEAHARRNYESRTGYFVTEAGICVDDHGYGYSSDGLVNGDGLIEIKAPIDSVKIDQILKTNNLDDYMHQMQGGMWITGRAWCDFIMYVPALENYGLDLYVKRVMRDDAFIDAMVLTLVDFSKLVNENKSAYLLMKAKAEQEALALAA